MGWPMLEKTLWQLNNIKDNKTFEKELIQYFQDMAKLFEKSEFTADDMVMLTTELLPTDPDQLEAMKARLWDILCPKDNKSFGFSSAMGDSAFTNLYNSVENKLNIHSKKSRPLKEEIKIAEAAIAEAKRIMAEDAENKRESEPNAKGKTPQEVIKANQKEIDLIKHALAISEKLASLSDSHKLECIATAFASFTKLTHFVPTVMQYSFSRQLFALSSNIVEMQKYNSVEISNEKDIEALHVAVANSYWEMNKVMMVLVNSVYKQLLQVKDQISQKTYNNLNRDLTRFANFTPVLSAPTVNIKTYQVIVDTFAKRYSALITNVKNAPKDVKEFERRSQEEQAVREADNQFNPEIYPYQINESTIRQSKNKMYEDQLILNDNEIANKNKFIVEGKLPDNLFQVKKDVERSLKINGEKVPKDIYENDAELRKFLDKELGKENTINLIRHYDQTIPILISAGISASGGSGEMGGIDFNPSSHSENVYVKNGVLFREAIIENIKIFVPDDPHSDERWIFKTNIKILSMGNVDGFAVTRIGSDSPFIRNSILLESTYPDLKNIVNKIVECEGALNKIKSTIDKDSAAQPKRELVDKTLNKINEFKQGKITFAELTKDINDLSPKTEVRSGRFGMRGMFSGTATAADAGKIVTDFAASLEKIKKDIANNRAVKDVIETYSPRASSPMSLRP
jgi:hypothetical protein